MKFDLGLGFLPNPFKANSTFTIIYEWLSLSLTQVASQLQGGSSTLLENTATGMIRHLIGTNINHRSAGSSLVRGAVASPAGLDWQLLSSHLVLLLLLQLLVGMMQVDY